MKYIDAFVRLDARGTYQPHPDPLPTLETAITAFLSSARWLHSAPEGIALVLLLSPSTKQKVRTAVGKGGSVLIDLGVCFKLLYNRIEETIIFIGCSFYLGWMLC